MKKYWNWNKRHRRKETEAFLVLFTTLLENGFSLQESLAVIDRTGQFRFELVERIQSQLARGVTLEAGLSELKLSVIERNQLRLAEEHGNLIATLSSICHYQKLMGKQKQLLQKVTTYPLLLLVFVGAVLFGMRRFLLPQLLASGMIDTDHWGIRLIQVMPLYAGIFIGGLSLISAGVVLGLSRQNALKRACFYGKVPILGSLYRIYHTSFFALEWGRLFQQGLELHQIIQCMLHTKEGTLMALFAKELDQELEQGGSLSHKLATYSFLTKEFPLIVFQGEVKGKLGDELFIYSQLLLEQLFKRVERALQWIQPIIFLLVALLIVGIYAAMFLPIYGNIQGVI